MSSWSVSKPPSCKAGQALQYRSSNPEYNGPRLNKTILKMPIKKLIKKKKGKGLSDIGPPIPTNFSWRNTGGNKISPPMDQEECGSCWSFSTTSVLSDRYAIKYDMASPKLSPLWLVSAFTLPEEYGPDYPRNQRCDIGGNTFLAGQWIEKNFVKLETCWPYYVMTDKSPGNVCPENLNTAEFENCCSTCCGTTNANYKFTVKKGTTKYLASGDGENADPEITTALIQRSIMSQGPVSASFNVPPNFMKWWNTKDNASGKIFRPSSPTEQNVGGHAVVLTGWGVQDGIRYWELRNSWGNSGDRGYCKFAFSLDTPKEFWTSLDVPFKDGDWWTGGCVAFEPGPLPENYQKIQGTGGSAIGFSYGNKSNEKVLFDVYWALAGVIVLVVLYLIYKKIK
jgi:C1A family cysteine protease